MKYAYTLIASLLLSAVSFTGKAQSVNGVAIKDIDVKYVQIVGTSKLLSNKLSIELDFGQENKLFVAKDTQVRDANNKLVVFNSMVDALNFMTANGYEFVQAYALTIQNQNVYHYLLKKK